MQHPRKGASRRGQRKCVQTFRSAEACDVCVCVCDTQTNQPVSRRACQCTRALIALCGNPEISLVIACLRGPGSCTCLSSERGREGEREIFTEDFTGSQPADCVIHRPANMHSTFSDSSSSSLRFFCQKKTLL
jgi:hypothetical protein